MFIESNEKYHELRRSDIRFHFDAAPPELAPLLASYYKHSAPPEPQALLPSAITAERCKNVARGESSKPPARFH
jgi:hypothetical protein